MKHLMTIPQGKLSADTVGDLINQMREEGNHGNASSQNTTASSDANKKTTIPKAVVSDNKELDQLCALLSSGEALEIDDNGEIVASGTAASKASSKDTAHSSHEKKGIPEAVVSAGQWYEKNKALYRMEVEAMRQEFNAPHLKPKFMKDGRMYWAVTASPKLREGYRCMNYTLLLIYEPDHPKVSYGTSVRVYLVNPSIEDLLDIVNRLPNVTPKNIPHTMTDSAGGRYLCTADTSNVSADFAKGVTSAVTSYRFAYRWLTIFELGIRSPVAWAKFQRHGEI